MVGGLLFWRIALLVVMDHRLFFGAKIAEYHEVGSWRLNGGAGELVAGTVSSILLVMR